MAAAIGYNSKLKDGLDLYFEVAESDDGSVIAGMLDLTFYVDIGTEENWKAYVAPGIVVNPQLAENQIERAIIWAISALKYGNLTFENGRIQESNFHDDPILRINEAPEMAVHFIEDDGPMGGIGEPGVPALAPAILNAIFDASGVRIRTLPVDRSELI